MADTPLDQMTFEQFLEDVDNYSASERLARAKKYYEYLVVSQGTVSSMSKDGVQLQRRIESIKDLIDILQEEASQEVAGLGWQARISQGYYWY